MPAVRTDDHHVHVFLINYFFQLFPQISVADDHLVPQSDDLAVEAKLPPQEIDQLHIGQPAGLRFSAFNQRTTPEINGTVDRISADISSDQRTGQNYYTVRVALPKEEIARLGDVKLVPGMPVEMFAKTYDRTVLSYFIKPLHDQAARAFRER